MLQKNIYYISPFSNLIIVWRIYICILGVHFKFFQVLNFNTACLMLLNINAHFSFLLILLFFLEKLWKKCWKNLRDNFSKCLESGERKTRSGAEASTLPECKLFTQMLFLRDSKLNRRTTSNVISNSLSVPRSNPSSSFQVYLL